MKSIFNWGSQLKADPPLPKVFIQENKQKKETKVDKTNAIVQEIHDSFNNYGDNLIKEAEEIINGFKENNRAETLASLGFTNMKEVTSFKQEKSKKIRSEEMAKIVSGYKQKYPLYKFITEKGVSDICSKYSLVCGEVSRYKGTVPDKNLLEIQNFNKIKEDIFNESGTCTLWYSMGRSGRTISVSQAVQYKNNDDTIVDKNDSYFICAPIKDMEMDRYDKVNSKGFVERNIPDPVVLFPVEHGFLIVSAWGLEASDEQITNEINN